MTKLLSSRLVARGIMVSVIVVVLVIVALFVNTRNEPGQDSALSPTLEVSPSSTQESAPPSTQESAPPSTQESFSGIFYVSETPFPCGRDLTKLCTTLEVAPASAEVSLPWASNINENEVVGADGTAIGTGYQNTTAIVSNGDSDPTASAAAYADAYIYDGKDDWFVPSKDELDELCKKFASDRQDTKSSESYDGRCTGSEKPSSGFAPEYYWSSSHYVNEHYTAYFAAWTQHFNNGHQTSYTTKNYLSPQDYMPYVRPVRAF